MPGSFQTSSAFTIDDSRLLTRSQSSWNLEIDTTTHEALDYQRPSYFAGLEMFATTTGLTNPELVSKTEKGKIIGQLGD